MTRILLALLIVLVGVTLAREGAIQVEPPRVMASEVKASTAAPDPLTRFYEEMGGVAVLGAPLGPEYVEQGKRVRSFENGRIELDPLTGKARLSPLGEMLGYRTPPISKEQIPPAGDPYRRYYAQTGHTVPYVLLAFYDAHGGPTKLGYPIAEFTVEDRHIVQYFQCVRLDYYPESQQVRLGPLGKMALERTPTSLPKANPTPTTLPKPTLHAFTKQVMASQGSKQTVYVRATDGQGRGIAGLPVRVMVSNHRNSLTIQGPMTDQGGYSSCSFLVEEERGTTWVEVIVTWQGEEIKARTSYIVW